MTHIDERPSEAPLGKPAFRDRCPWGDFVAPELSRVAEEARWLAEPAAAAIACLPWRGGKGQGVLVTSTRLEVDEQELIQRWLAGVESSCSLSVPLMLRPRLGCSRALAVPMQGPTRRVGALALPLRAGWGPMARELEGLGSDFARRLEAADQRALRVFLRIASVGGRPVGRRDREHSTPNPPSRVLALRAPRPRTGHPSPRHADLVATALGRDGTASLPRR